MDRRTFLRAAPLLPMVATTPAMAETHAYGVPGQRRISCETGDPGERLYGIIYGDGMEVDIYLDGVEQEAVITADERAGEILRYVMTPKGNFADNITTGMPLTETLRGNVRLVVRAQTA